MSRCIGMRLSVDAKCSTYTSGNIFIIILCCVTRMFHSSWTFLATRNLDGLIVLFHPLRASS